MFHAKTRIALAACPLTLLVLPFVGAASATTPVALEPCASAAAQPAAVKSAPKRVEDERTRVAILIFDNVEIIDFTGPWEVFGAAGYEVFSVATTRDMIRTNNGMQIVPNHALHECPDPSVLLIPGGGIGDALQSEEVREWLLALGETSDLVLSVCNGAFIVANTGMLDGLTATTTRGLIDRFSERFPKVETLRNRRWVDNGKIITAGGLSAGIDAALHVVERLDGRAQADDIAHSLEYEWRHNPIDAPETD